MKFTKLLKSSNLTKAVKDTVGGKKLLHARCPQNDSQNRIQSSFNLWFLTKNFACKDITVFGMCSNYITNAPQCLTKWINNHSLAHISAEAATAQG